MERPSLLSSIFGPALWQSSPEQNVPHYQALLSLLYKFLEDCSNCVHSSPGNPALPVFEPHIFQALTGTLQVLGNQQTCLFMPEYGCVAFAACTPSTITGFEPNPHASLFLVALDSYGFQTQRVPGCVGHTAVSGGHVTLQVGSVDAQQTGRFFARLQELAAKRKKEAGQNREGAYHRNSPSFIYALTQEILEQACPRQGGGTVHHPLRGGFLDIASQPGTGHDNSWPLVWQGFLVVAQQLLLPHAMHSVTSRGRHDMHSTHSSSGSETEDEAQQQHLCPSSSVCDHLRAYFELWLLHGELTRLKPETCTQQAVNACMVMLQSAAAKGAQLASEGHSIHGFEVACCSLVDRLKALAASRAHAHAQQFQLPNMRLTGTTNAIIGPDGCPSSSKASMIVLTDSVNHHSASGNAADTAPTAKSSSKSRRTSGGNSANAGSPENHGSTGSSCYSECCSLYVPQGPVPAPIQPQMPSVDACLAAARKRAADSLPVLPVLGGRVSASIEWSAQAAQRVWPVPETETGVSARTAEDLVPIVSAETKGASASQPLVTSSSPSSSKTEPILGAPTVEKATIAPQVHAENLIASFTDLLAWLRDACWTSKVLAGEGHAGLLLRLRTVEHELFSRAIRGFADVVLNDAEAGALEEVVDVYRLLLQRFQQVTTLDPPGSPDAEGQAQGSSPGILRTDLRSRCVLVAWVAYCLLHAAACTTYSTVAKFGVGLDWEDLRHLALADREATDACLAVIAYLQPRMKPGWGLFCLRGTGSSSATNGAAPTFALARQFAEACPRLRGILSEQQKVAEARVNTHWQEVQSKREELRELREQLRDLDTKIPLLEAQLRDAQVEAANLGTDFGEGGLSRSASLARAPSLPQALQRSASSAIHTPSTNVLSRELAEAKHARVHLQSYLKASGTPPPPVLQPLPSNESTALVWLFFLHMPPLLRHLGRSTFLAQQLLLPGPELAIGKGIDVGVPTCPLSVVDYYNQKQQHMRAPKATGNVTLVSRGVVPTSVGASHVDQTTARGDGVWYPDSLSLEIAWTGSGCAADSYKGVTSSPSFNPFAPIPARLVARSFTDSLPAGDVSLQWAIDPPSPDPSISLNRGNWAIARQALCPPWLSKPGFMAYGSLRAFPLRQLRNLCAVLRTCSLPLNHPSVQLLLRQCLYHIGPASFSGQHPHLAWRAHWEEEGGVLQTLCDELSRLAADLEDTPREHGAVLLLGEMAAFLSSWYPACSEVAQQFSGMVLREADKLERQGQQPRRQCHLCMLSILCYRTGPPLSVKAAATLLKLMVKVKHAAALHGAQEPGLLACCQAVMTRRCDELISTFQHHPNLLTEAAACVLPEVPGQLPWVQLQHGRRGTCSFQAASVGRRRDHAGRDERQSHQTQWSQDKQDLDAGPQQPQQHQGLWREQPQQAEGLRSHQHSQASKALQASTQQHQPTQQQNQPGQLQRTHVYSICVLTGSVLLDGRAPGCLPAEILHHPLKTRVFGPLNFEVSATEEGLLRSTAPIHGCFYTFSLTGSQLTVFEEDAKSGDCLELLDVSTGSCSVNNRGKKPGPGQNTAAHSSSSSSSLNAERAPCIDFSSTTQAGQACTSHGGASEGRKLGPGQSPAGRGFIGGTARAGEEEHWAEQLPVRFRALYSHWFCRRRGIVLLRPLSALHPHCAHHVIRVVPAARSSEAANTAALNRRSVSAGKQQLLMWRVPMQLRYVNWVQLWDMLTINSTARSSSRNTRGDTMELRAGSRLPPEHAQQLQQPAPMLVDQLALCPGSPVLSVLAKFEDPQFIHTYASMPTSPPTPSPEAIQPDQQRAQGASAAAGASSFPAALDTLSNSSCKHTYTPPMPIPSTGRLSLGPLASIGGPFPPSHPQFDTTFVLPRFALSFRLEAHAHQAGGVQPRTGVGVCGGSSALRGCQQKKRAWFGGRIRKRQGAFRGQAVMSSSSKVGKAAASQGRRGAAIEQGKLLADALQRQGLLTVCEGGTRNAPSSCSGVVGRKRVSDAAKYVARSVSTGRWDRGVSACGKRKRQMDLAGSLCQQQQQQQEQGHLNLPRSSASFLQLVSQDFSGYVLAGCQQLVKVCPRTLQPLSYTLPGFQQYLVLQQAHTPGSCPLLGGRKAKTLVVIPAGQVGFVDGRGSEGAHVQVRVPEACDAAQQVHCYEMHGRYGNLRAPSISARLQLAALYAATSTLLPEPHSHMTGVQVAMQLLRQCWTNAPLPQADVAQLRGVAALGGHLAPGLKLLAYELELSTLQLSHLYSPPPGAVIDSSLHHLHHHHQQQQQQQQQQQGHLPQVPINAKVQVHTPFTPLRSGITTPKDSPAASVKPASHSSAAPKPASLPVARPSKAAPAASALAALRRPTCNPTAPGPGTKCAADHALKDGNSAGLDLAESSSPIDPDAGTCYFLDTSPGRGCPAWSRFGVHPRLALDPLEERRVLGLERELMPEPYWMRAMCRHRTGQVDVPECPVDASLISATEAKLAAMVRSRDRSGIIPPPYPLLHAMCVEGTPAPVAGATSSVGSVTSSAAGSPSPLEQEMHDDLKTSWNTYHTMPLQDELAAPQEEVLKFAVQLQAHVASQLKQVEDFLEARITGIPDNAGGHGTSFRLKRLCDAAPFVNKLDLTCAAFRHWSFLLQFNPFLSKKACRRLQADARIFLQLCVLEDRLARVCAFAVAGSDWRPLLIQDLLCTRTWDVAAHPKWLVMEAEGGLQIRPAQYLIAEHLMHNPGAVAQLNMGEGKTRVILPMLGLHWAEGKHNVVRLNFLSQLLDESHAHLHSFLTASVLNVKLFKQPFHRDVALTLAGVAALRSSLNYCQQVGGLLLAAPEHRLSMQLKRDELWASDPCVCAALDELSAIKYVDIMDENDLLLHHRFQLVYSCGAQSPLPSLQARATAAQALLHAASVFADVPGSVLNAPGAAVRMGADDPSRRPGSFAGLRLLPGCALDAVLPQLYASLASMLIKSPPVHELRWLKSHPDKERLAVCMTDCSSSVEDAVDTAAWASLNDTQKHHVLALRGLMAGKQLVHCLSKQHRVEYGIKRHSGAACKRLAVPFRAADLPSERSEWSQPDVALLLTLLSYYQDGLSLKELLQALEQLSYLGANAQRSVYGQWLKTSQACLPQGQLDAVNDISKLDTQNAQQAAVLHHCFSHNMHVVDFWLSTCVFPVETKQFPQRLVCSGWDLADNAQIVGFSGTSDNHRLLPLQVYLSDPGVPALKAIDGHMLSLLLSNPTFLCMPELSGLRNCSEPVCQSTLEAALAHNVDALIDCGALLAGLNTRLAAEWVLPRLHARFKGVCFFDIASKQWTIFDTSGRCYPRHSSPIAEREAFVIFDDARCRGADLQLHKNARGMLTLGPGLCKDKLMQAAGRMRLLGRGQSLCFIATQEVASAVRIASQGFSRASGTSTGAAHILGAVCQRGPLQQESQQTQRHAQQPNQQLLQRHTGGHQQQQPQNHKLEQGHHHHHQQQQQQQPQNHKLEQGHHYQQQQQQQQPHNHKLVQDQRQQLQSQRPAEGQEHNHQALTGGLGWDQQAPLTSWHVLVWVMANSRSAMQQGVLDWACKGLHFAASRAARAASGGRPLVLEEVMELQQLWGGGRVTRSVAEQVQLMAQQLAWQQPQGQERPQHQQLCNPGSQGQQSQCQQLNPSDKGGLQPGVQQQHGAVDLLNHALTSQPPSQPLQVPRLQEALDQQAVPQQSVIQRDQGQQIKPPLQPFLSAGRLVQGICERSSRYGHGLSVASNPLGPDDECENQLEKEEEVQQQEPQIELPQVQPCDEVGWDYATVFGAQSATDLKHLVPAATKEQEQLHDGEGSIASQPDQDLDHPQQQQRSKQDSRYLQQQQQQQHYRSLPLPQVVKSQLPSELHSIPWSPRIFCTLNFIRTVTSADAPPRHHQRLPWKQAQQAPSPTLLPMGGRFARPADSLLLFPDSSILLVSDREADGLQSQCELRHYKLKEVGSPGTQQPQLHREQQDQHQQQGDGLVAHVPQHQQNGEQQRDKLCAHMSQHQQDTKLQQGGGPSAHTPQLSGPVLMQLCYARLAIDEQHSMPRLSLWLCGLKSSSNSVERGEGLGCRKQQVEAGVGWRAWREAGLPVVVPGLEEVVQLQLFNGETMFSSTGKEGRKAVTSEQGGQANASARSNPLHRQGGQHPETGPGGGALLAREGLPNTADTNKEVTALPKLGGQELQVVTGSREAARERGNTANSCKMSRELLRQLVAGRYKAVAELVELRGTASLLPHSHVEHACEQELDKTWKLWSVV